MNIVEIQDKTKWKDFIVQNKGSFLQSWEWGEVQSDAGKKVWRLVAVENEKILNAILIIKYNLKFGKSYLFAPWASDIKNEYKYFSEKIKEIAAAENSIFFRHEPMVETNFPIENLVSSNFIYAGAVEPKDTLLVDLSKSEEELLSEMHPKTRYNVRLAEKKEVKINRYRSSTVQEWEFENFWRLIEQTYKRKSIKAHSKNYYQKIFKQDIFQLYLAEYQGKIIVANLISFFGDTVTYLHGGSDKNYQNTMAAALIQWQAIKDAKAQGYRYYDFYGIAKDNDKKNPWVGITRFKKGFGGFEKHYIGAWDLVFSKGWYFLYKTGRKVRNF